MGDDVNRPNARFPHAFIVMRIDEFRSSVENSISPVATYLDRALADEEMTRLSALTTGNDSRYVVLISRLKG